MRGIITSDWHLSANKPRCRKNEDWISDQRFAIQTVINHANDHNCDIYIIGDIFDIPKVPPEISNMLINEGERMKGIIYLIAGNHEMPYHNPDLIYQASIYPFVNGSLKKFKPIPNEEGISADNFGKIVNEDEIMFMHTLVFSKKIPPNTKAITAIELLKQNTDAKYIFTGDNHESFVVPYLNQYLINPGSLLTLASDQNYPHYIYYVDTNKDIIESIEIPDYCEIVTDSYVQESNERNDRIKAFASLIKEKVTEGKGSGIDFKENVRLSMKNNKKLTPGSIKIINGFLEK
jgi:DNA repair exonuclease SbcCD nuclease subunit